MNLPRRWIIRWAKWLTDRLPSVSMLTDAEWRLRHRAIISVYGVLFVVVLLVGLATEPWLHAVGQTSLMLVPGLLLMRTRRRLAVMSLMSGGLLLGAGLLVHFTHGLIESHFSFFVLLPMIALYHDWRPFVWSIVWVAVSHGVIGGIDPSSIYSHPAAIAAPFKWALIHAAYVLALAAVMITHWNFAERPRLALKSALKELQDTQSQLLQAQKLESIGVLAAGVAHELNTPIQFVGDNLRFLTGVARDLERLCEALDALPRTGTGTPEIENPIARIHDLREEIDLGYLMDEMPRALEQSLEGVARVAEIVRAMKGFSHPSQDVIPLDLNRLISDTAIVARNEWKYVADLELVLDESLPATPVAGGPFNQVILNLLVNAAHAIEERYRTAEGKGHIEIRSRSESGVSVVTVADNGTGIPREVADRVFEQFFTTKEVGKGTGLGLAVCRSIIGGFGGTLTFSSEPGAGTTFEIRLPQRVSSTERSVA